MYCKIVTGGSWGHEITLETVMSVHGDRIQPD